MVRALISTGPSTDFLTPNLDTSPPANHAPIPSTTFQASPPSETHRQNDASKFPQKNMDPRGLQGLQVEVVQARQPYVVVIPTEVVEGVLEGSASEKERWGDNLHGAKLVSSGRKRVLCT